VYSAIHIGVAWKWLSLTREAISTSVLLTCLLLVLPKVYMYSAIHIGVAWKWSSLTREAISTSVLLTCLLLVLPKVYSILHRMFNIYMKY
jgi:hypothetical protein